MKSGTAGMGHSKHRKSGYSTQSPKQRFMRKLEAEKNEVKDKNRIKNPKSNVGDLFKSKI